MLRSKKDTNKAEAIKTEEEIIEEEILYYKKLVYKVRRSKNADEVNIAFNKIVEKLDSKIKKIAGKFRIPGNTFDDTYQECLIALQTKAIEDYDEKRGSEPNKIAPFDRFALLCIRRHLSTKFKASNGNKARTLNDGKSIDQDRSTDNSELSLIDVLCTKEKSILVKIQERENFLILMKKLVKRLSPFEIQVLTLYAKQFTYEEIAKYIKEKNPKSRVNVKSVDNCLSRIKQKSKNIMELVNNKR